jgi:hypothetical protein
MSTPSGTASPHHVNIMYFSHALIPTPPPPQTNEVTTALGAANILLYAGIYTPLKQLSIYNTWVGAVVGAIPPVMGWASAAGSIEPGAAVLAAALFSWQMPHFLALAWLCKADYLRGGFRMISGADLTGRITALPALRHAAYLLPLGAAAHAAGLTTAPFAFEAAVLAAAMCAPAARFLASPSQPAARTLFRASLLYLPLLLIAAVVHRQPNTHTLTVDALADRCAAALEGPPHSGVLPLMRAAGERTLEAGSRLLGFGADSLRELRCPSTVHSDDGRPRASARTSGGGVITTAQITTDGTHSTATTVVVVQRRGPEGQGDPAAVSKQVVVAQAPQGGPAGGGQQQQEGTEDEVTTVKGVGAVGSWRSGLGWWQLNGVGSGGVVQQASSATATSCRQGPPP